MAGAPAPHPGMQWPTFIVTDLRHGNPPPGGNTWDQVRQTMADPPYNITDAEEILGPRSQCYMRAMQLSVLHPGGFRIAIGFNPQTRQVAFIRYRQPDGQMTEIYTRGAPPTQAQLDAMFAGF